MVCEYRLQIIDLRVNWSCVLVPVLWQVDRLHAMHAGFF